MDLLTALVEKLNQLELRIKLVSCLIYAIYIHVLSVNISDNYKSIKI